MKKNEIIEINGIEFKYHKGIRDMYIHYGDLSECYVNPSWKKRCIFDGWRRWFNNTSNNHICGCFGIYSYNCHNFSLIMQMEYQGNIYRLYVTSMNNYYEVIA